MQCMLESTCLRTRQARRQQEEQRQQQNVCGTPSPPGCAEPGEPDVDRVSFKVPMLVQEAERKRQAEEQERQAAVAAAAAAAASAGCGGLPEGWIAQQDPNSGQTFYANTKTGKAIVD